MECTTYLIRQYHTRGLCPPWSLRSSSRLQPGTYRMLYEKCRCGEEIKLLHCNWFIWPFALERERHRRWCAANRQTIRTTLGSQRCFSAGAASATPTQHWGSVGSAFRDPHYGADLLFAFIRESLQPECAPDRHPAIGRNVYFAQYEGSTVAQTAQVMQLQYNEMFKQSAKLFSPRPLTILPGIIITSPLRTGISIVSIVFPC